MAEIDEYWAGRSALGSGMKLRPPLPQVLGRRVGAARAAMDVFEKAVDERGRGTMREAADPDGLARPDELAERRLADRAAYWRRRCDARARARGEAGRVPRAKRRRRRGRARARVAVRPTRSSSRACPRASRSSSSAKAAAGGACRSAVAGGAARPAAARSRARAEEGVSVGLEDVPAPWVRLADAGEAVAAARGGALRGGARRPSLPPPDASFPSRGGEDDVALYEVAGRSGALLREGVELATAVVGELPEGALVEVDAEARGSAGAPRVRVRAYTPRGGARVARTGWGSKKLFSLRRAAPTPGGGVGARDGRAAFSPVAHLSDAAYDSAEPPPDGNAHPMLHAPELPSATLEVPEHVPAGACVQIQVPRIAREGQSEVEPPLLFDVPVPVDRAVGESFTVYMLTPLAS